MHMTFWFSPSLGTFLFDGFVVDTTGAFVATCAGLCAMAVLLEFLKFIRMRGKSTSPDSHLQNPQNGGSETSALLSGSRFTGKIHRMLLVGGEVLLYYIQVSSNWMVMLAVMGYNGYVFLSVVAGAGLGYALFGESIAHARIKSVKMKAGVLSCGVCRVKDELDVNTPGQSDPPIDSHPVPSISGTWSQEVSIHPSGSAGEST